MALSTDLTGELESINDLLLPPSDLSESLSPLKPHLEVEANDLHDLLVSWLESNVFLVSILLCLALENDLDLIALIAYWEAKELRVFESVRNILRVAETRFNLTRGAADGVDHLA